MSFLNMHFRLGNYEYTGGKYLPLVMKGSRHRGWDQTGITQTLQKYKTCVRSAHSHKNSDFRNRNKYKKDHTIFVVTLPLFTPVTATQKEIRLRERKGR